MVNNTIVKTQRPQVKRPRERLPEQINRLCVHRISFADDYGGERLGMKFFPDVRPIPDEQLTGWNIIERFADTRQVHPGRPHWADRPGVATGGAVPYTFLIRCDGSIDQIEEITTVTQHARKWNVDALGVAVAGDFRKRPPTPEQWHTALIPFLGVWKSWGLVIVGHDQLPGGSKDPDKKCPGPMLPMESLVKDVERAGNWRMEPLEAKAQLLEWGIIF